MSHPVPATPVAPVQSTGAHRGDPGRLVSPHNGVRLPSADRAAEGRRRANRTRAEWQIALALGEVTIKDFIEEACSWQGVALRCVSLQSLVTAQAGVGEVRARAFLDEFEARLGHPRARRNAGKAAGHKPVGKRPVSWLIDPRAGGKRLLAFLDVMDQSPSEPWPGFPLAAPPAWMVASRDQVNTVTSGVSPVSASPEPTSPRLRESNPVPASAGNPPTQSTPKTQSAPPQVRVARRRQKPASSADNHQGGSDA